MVGFRDIFQTQGASGTSFQDVFTPLSPPVVTNPTPEVVIVDGWFTEAGEYYLAESGDFYYLLGYVEPGSELPPEPDEPPFIPPPVEQTAAFTSWGQTDITFAQLDGVTFAELG